VSNLIKIRGRVSGIIPHFWPHRHAVNIRAHWVSEDYGKLKSSGAIRETYIPWGASDPENSIIWDIYAVYFSIVSNTPETNGVISSVAFFCLGKGEEKGWKLE
jgi:hypothetical protein